MQDYDIVFFLLDIENISYKKNKSWINQFGEVVILILGVYQRIRNNLKR